jgi:hypothetical protein
MKRLYSSMAFLQAKNQQSPASPEAKTIAAIEKSGGTVRTLAQNDDRLEVAFNLQGATVADKDLAPLAQLKKVAYVNLAKTGITDAGLASLKPLTDLIQLHLELTKITDAGLAQIAGLKKLEYLNLYGTNVTDACVKPLSGLTNLKNLYLWQSKVTKEGVEKLRKALPNTDINLGWETEPVKK